MLSQKLKHPISWKTPDSDVRHFLDHLQGNILKYHGRNNVVFLFCHFRADRRHEALSFVRQQVARVASAKHQLDLADAKKATGTKSTAPFVTLLFTKHGYDYLGIEHAHQPADPSFQAGMAAAGLNDPPQASWDGPLRDPHMLIIVGTIGPVEAQHEATELLNDISDICHVGVDSGEIIGNQFFNGAGQGVENFGYVDGRSQPLVLTEDFPAEIANGGMDKWPLTLFPVDQFVVRDPAIGAPSAYGSYFVFRQLEQDVRGFKTREDEIVSGHEETFDNRDSAGVGRLESGSPFELRKDDVDAGGTAVPPDITNNFTFTSNPPKCPAFAHIRKVNPRTAATQGALMIRRGMTYGTRADASPKPGDPSMLVLDDTVATASLPTGCVGLLFQSYQANIAKQFETSQRWANSATDGVDPVIGQTSAAVENWPNSYGAVAPNTESLDFYQRTGDSKTGPYVRLRGGGYFFAPSLPFLASL